MLGGKSVSYGLKVKNYVFSHHPLESTASDVEFVREPIAGFAKRLHAAPGKDIWMMGGGGIIASFLDEGQLDEFIIHVVPIFIGEGIPLIQPRHRSVRLELLSSHAFPDGVVRLHYKVPNSPSGKQAIAKPRSRKRR